ncbi:uncharacterized protein LOC143072113 [Mytilus galloprovincialis]|uniref:uncharacterized protein LOC143072113 n=1 Tax=Mytilus galloprovincialis TaxID=29158 RepID=UPI003F7BD432
MFLFTFLSRLLLVIISLLDHVDALGYYYYNRAYYLSYQNYVQYRNYLYYRNRYYSNYYNYYYSSNSGSNSLTLRDKFNVGVTGGLIGALVGAVLFVVLIACVCYRRRKRSAITDGITNSAIRYDANELQSEVQNETLAVPDHVTIAADGESRNETLAATDHMTTVADGEFHNEPRDTSDHATNAPGVEFHNETADSSYPEAVAFDEIDHIKLNDTTNHAVTSSDGLVLNERDNELE